MSEVRLSQLVAYLPNGTVVTGSSELKSVTGAVAWDAKYAIESRLRVESAVYISNAVAEGRGTTRAIAIRRAKPRARRAVAAK